MSVMLTVRDETASGNVYHSLPLEFPSERITVRDLIRERVYQEVQDFNRHREEHTFRGLVQPTDAEKVLNGDRTEYRLKKRRDIDWKQQFEKALDAFDHNGFFLIVDDKQAESLDQEVVIGRDTQVSFVRLLPLVGG
jgi:hypothetical protein